MRQRSTPLPAMMPASGIVPYYVAQASQLTKAPPVYHIGSLLTVLGAILDPLVGLYYLGEGVRRRERLFLWTLLLGPTGNKKSYTSDLALQVARPWLGQRMRSPEGGRRALDSMLIEQNDPVLHVREAGGWFTGNRQAYMVDGASFWNSAYDGFYQPRNDAGGVQTEGFRVGITLLMAGPEKEVTRTTRRSDWLGGLFPRLVIFLAGQREPGKGGFDWPEEVLRKLEAAIARMVEVVSTAGHMVMSKQARILWERWQDDHDARLLRCSDLHASIGSRLPWHVQRIAGIYAATRFSHVVGREDVRAACILGRYLRDCSMSLEPGY